MAARPLTGRKVLLIFLGFFGAVFAANGIMMVIAARTFDGVVVEDAYRKGRDFNQTLAAARAQDALGWSVDFGDAAMDTPTERLVTARLFDETGAPLRGFDVAISYFSPVEEEEDRSVTLAALGDGLYQGRISLPRAGRWQMRLQAGVGEDVRYQLRKEVMIRP